MREQRDCNNMESHSLFPKYVWLYRTSSFPCWLWRSPGLNSHLVSRRIPSGRLYSSTPRILTISSWTIVVRLLNKKSNQYKDHFGFGKVTKKKFCKSCNLVKYWQQRYKKSINWQGSKGFSFFSFSLSHFLFWLVVGLLFLNILY